MIGTVLQNRYQIEEEIGRGGMGIVYRARDLSLDRPVAVKILSENATLSSGKERMLNESRVAARLSHPYIINIYDAGIYDTGIVEAGKVHERPYIIMELVQGESLRSKHPSIAEALDIAMRICEALEHAHSCGVIHRDLKPENVILTITNGIKLMDFGLARILSLPSFTEEGTIIGTFLYIAPELLLGENPSPQSDLYALGVILYELLYERHPFSGNDLITLISQHLHAPIVPPSTYNLDITPELDSLILQLLSKQPADRPDSAAAARQMLSAVLSPEAGKPAVLSLPRGLSLLDRIVRGRLVGREREMAELRVIWQRAFKGEGSILLISGEPGIGKSRLARELSAMAEFSKGLSFFSQSYPEGGAPFAPIARLLRKGFLEKGWRMAALPRVVIADLVAVVPELSAIFPDVPLNPSLDPASEQQRLYESLAAFLTAVTRIAPLLLVIDDAHWVDSATLFLIRYLARQVSRQRLLIVLTYRETELDERLPLNEVIADINRERVALRIKLTRLSRDQAREMFGIMFGLEADKISTELVDVLYNETEGNPFFLEEVCKALVEEGAIYRESGEWRLAYTQEISIPQSLRIAIQARISKLPEPVQSLLTLAAIQGREFDFEVLRRVSGQEEEALIDAIEAAERAQLVSRVGNRQKKGIVSPAVTYSFAHVLIPTTLRESINSLRRQRLHRRVAEALLGLRPEDYETLAYHYGNAGDVEQVCKYYTLAGHRARALYANRDAIRFYSEALALLEEEAARYDLLAARSAVYDLTGQHSKQVEDAQEMVAYSEKHGDVGRYTDALLALGSAYMEVEPGQAHGVASRAIKSAEFLQDWARQGFAYRLLGRSALVLLDRLVSQKALETSVDCFCKANLPAEAAVSLRFLAMAFLNGGKLMEQQKALEEALALSRSSGDRRQEAIAIYQIAVVHNMNDRFWDAEPLIHQALSIFRQVGDRKNEANALNLLAFNLAMLGKPAESEEMFWQVLRLAEQSGSVSLTWRGVFNLVWAIMVQQGRLEEGLALFTQYMEQARQRNEVFLLKNLQGTTSVLLFMLGQFERALEMKFDELGGEEIVEVVGSGISGPNLALIGRYQSELHQYERAKRNLERALRMGEDNDQPLEIIDALMNLVFLAEIEHGDAGLCDTLALGLRARELAEGSGSGDWIAKTAGMLALQQMLCGDLASAQRNIDAALESIDSLFTRVDLAEKVLLNACWIYRSLSLEEEANTYLERAYIWIMEVSSKISNEELRRGWLERVRQNRLVVQEKLGNSGNLPTQ